MLKYHLWREQTMSEHFTYKPEGVCSRLMEFDIQDGTIESFQVVGGCNGNLKGIGSLLKGMKVEEVIRRLEGTTCGPRPTSCPDQISRALKSYLAANQ